MTKPAATLFARRSFTLAEVIVAVAIHAGVTQVQMCSRDRRRHIVQARRMALSVWRRCARTQSDMAAALGISQAAASLLVNSGNQRALAVDVDAVIAVLRIGDALKFLSCFDRSRIAESAEFKLADET